MIAVQRDFAERSQEISRYFLFLRHFADRHIEFLPNPDGTLLMGGPDRDALFKTLKANGFLLLYNLVESSLRNAIEAIFDELNSRNVSFDQCRKEVRRIVLSNLKQHSVDVILPSLTQLSVDVVAKTFRKEELFAGNIDTRKVRDIAATYGFPRPIRTCDDLLIVKTNRNDLAHGNKSFADVGRDYDIDRLEQIQREVIDFMRDVLDNISEYISHQVYLDPPLP